MKVIKMSVLSLVFLGLSLIWSCGGDGGGDPVVLEFLDRVSGTWTITSAKENNATATFSTTGFSMTINKAGSYSITLGSLPVEAKPNYKSTSNSGTWALASSNTQLVFDGNTVAAVTIVSFTPTDNTKPLETMTVRFTTDSKTAPTYEFVLAKQ